jgi:hypothetical protein
MPLVPPYIESLRPYEAGRSIEDRPLWQGLLVQGAGPPGHDDVVVDAIAHSRRGVTGRQTDQRRVRVGTSGVVRGIRAKAREHQRVRPLPHGAARPAHPQSVAGTQARVDRLERVKVRPGVGPQHVFRRPTRAHTLHDLGDDHRFPRVLARGDLDVQMRWMRSEIKLVIEQAGPARERLHFAGREAQVVTLHPSLQGAQRFEHVAQRAEVIRRSGCHHDHIVKLRTFRTMVPSWAWYDTWNVGIATLDRPLADVRELAPLKHVRWLPPRPPLFLVADPFPYRHQGRDWLLVEEYGRIVGIITRHDVHQFRFHSNGSSAIDRGGNHHAWLSHRPDSKLLETQEAADCGPGAV